MMDCYNPAWKIVNSYTLISTYLNASECYGKATLNMCIHCVLIVLAKSCPGTIPNGKLSESCGVKVGTTCEYSCNTGYQKNTTVPTISCEPSTNWSSDPHSLCNSKL